MQKRTLLLLLCATGFASAVVPAPAQILQTYQCRDGKEFVLEVFASRRTAFLHLEGHRLSLRQRILALPGSKRYTNSEISVTTRGQTARLKRVGKTVDCELSKPD